MRAVLLFRTCLICMKTYFAARPTQRFYATNVPFCRSFHDRFLSLFLFRSHTVSLCLWSVARASPYFVVHVCDVLMSHIGRRYRGGECKRENLCAMCLRVCAQFRTHNICTICGGLCYVNGRAFVAATCHQLAEI